MWLFRFPRLRNTRYRAARNSAVTSLVVVLPALPVMATTFVPDCAPHVARQRLQRRERVVDLDDGRRRAIRAATARRRPPRSTIAPRAAAARQRIGREVRAVEPLALRSR